MKHHIRNYEKYFSVYHYIEVLKKKPVHVRHIYALVIAGTITALIAAFILYVDYGFWHDRYIRTEEVEVTTGEEDQMITVRSPREMIDGFFDEARKKVKTIQFSNPARVLEGKEKYSKDSDVQ